MSDLITLCNGSSILMSIVKVVFVDTNKLHNTFKIRITASQKEEIACEYKTYDDLMNDLVKIKESFQNSKQFTLFPNIAHNRNPYKTADGKASYVVKQAIKNIALIALSNTLKLSFGPDMCLNVSFLTPESLNEYFYDFVNGK